MRETRKGNTLAKQKESKTDVSEGRDGILRSPTSRGIDGRRRDVFASMEKAVTLVDKPTFSNVSMVSQAFPNAFPSVVLGDSSRARSLIDVEDLFPTDFEAEALRSSSALASLTA